ncbi:ABC transporter permease [Paenibacillus guangzhouensis]|uniref:ABC transporter permease n=1 Tax=Paenibacillus guangzhouensis TaxID=1473112 RepID=UPI001D1285C3|nr:ABC transporter permease subunit [Paenibacillus guangzhouensis]
MHSQTGSQPKMNQAPALGKARNKIGGNGLLYILAIPGLMYLLMFCYLPMAGLVVVFKNYNFMDGIFGSPWVGFENFRFFFSSFDKAWRATQNTVLLNSCYIVFGTAISLILALLFNEIKGKTFLKVAQSVSFFPYFISWAVAGGLLLTLIDYDKGTVEQLLQWLGFAKIDFFSEPKYWPVILTISSIWKFSGYNAIIFYAVLRNIDPSYYESAIVEGATRVQQMVRISLPLLRPTIIILTLLAVGRIFYGDLTMMLGLTNLNPVLFSTTDIIDTFVYRSVIKNGEFAMASAVGLYQSIFGFVLVIVFNYVAGRFDKDYKIF